MTTRGVRGAAVAGLLALITLAPWGARAAEEPVDEVTIERMAYVVDGPSDPYAADPATVHVGVTGGKEFARSYFRLSFDLLPDKAILDKVSLTLRITQSAEASGNSVYQTYNVNHEAALLQACILTSELKASFDGKNPPGYDCAHGSAVGVRGTGDAWNFDLTPLADAWSKAGNTGAVIVPIASTATDTWAISFFKARSTYGFSYTLPPAPPPKPAPGNPKPASHPIPREIPAPYPFPTAAPTLAAPAPAQPVPQAPGAITVPGVRSTAWTWVLPLCLSVALLTLATSQRHALAAAGNRIAALRANLRLRPRAHTLAAVVVVWGLLFASYSVVVAPPSRLISSGGGPGSESPTGGGPSQPGGGTGPATPTTGPSRAPGTGSPLPGSPGAPGPKPAGTYQRLGNINVFFPADGSAPVAQLYSGADDVVGLDYANKRVKLCGHAAMTYGPAFDISEEDILVFWQWLNERGGINGWKFDMDVIDDGYDPGKAVQAAQTCKDSGAFMLLSGIGFDQIPAVRQWAEQNHELYLHHVVTKAGSRGLKYSFTSLPSEEQLGIWAGQVAVQKFRGKKVGILYRQSPNWQSGHDLFLETIRGKLTVVGDRPVQKNQGNYTQDVAALREADVIFAWENALGTVEMIEAAQAQQMHPAWIVFPFNLQTETLGDSALDQPLYGIAAWDAYDHAYHGGPYSAYATDIETFEAAYRQYDPSANLGGLGGDILYLTWQAYRGLADLFTACGPNCTRNKMAAALLTYNKSIHGYCHTDFTRGDRHHGGWVGNTVEVYRGPGGPAWKPLQRCIGSF